MIEPHEGQITLSSPKCCQCGYRFREGEALIFSWSEQVCYCGPCWRKKYDLPDIEVNYTPAEDPLLKQLRAAGVRIPEKRRSREGDHADESGRFPGL